MLPFGWYFQEAEIQAMHTGWEALNQGLEALGGRLYSGPAGLG